MCTNNTTTFSKEYVIVSKFFIILYFFQNRTVKNEVIYNSMTEGVFLRITIIISFFFFKLILFELQFNGHSVECFMKNHIHLSFQEWVLFYVLIVPYTKSSSMCTQYCCLDFRDYIWTGSLALCVPYFVKKKKILKVWSLFGMTDVWCSCCKTNQWFKFYLCFIIITK